MSEKSETNGTNLNNVREVAGMYAQDLAYFEKMFDLCLRGYYTAMPAVVVAVYPKTQTVDIRPLLKHYYPAEDVNVSRPVIEQVPFQFQRAGDTWISLPIKPGDTGIALFCCRDISAWKETGGEVLLQSKHIVDYNDAVFLPFVGAKAQAVGNYNPDYIEIVKNGKTITVKDGTLEAPEYHFVVKSIYASETIQADGTITSAKDCISGGVSGKGHIHSGVQSGDKNTNPPVL